MASLRGRRAVCRLYSRLYSLETVASNGFENSASSKSFALRSRRKKSDSSNWLDVAAWTIRCLASRADRPCSRSFEMKGRMRALCAYLLSIIPRSFLPQLCIMELSGPLAILETSKHRPQFSTSSSSKPFAASSSSNIAFTTRRQDSWISAQSHLKSLLGRSSSS